MGDVQIILDHPLFQGVDRRAMDRMLDTSEEVRVEKGEHIYTPSALPAVWASCSTARWR